LNIGQFFMKLKRAKRTVQNFWGHPV